jgi:hypothetical protein
MGGATINVYVDLRKRRRRVLPAVALDADAGGWKHQEIVYVRIQPWRR